MKNEIVLFESEDGEVKLDVELVENTIWLTEGQMAALFGRDEAEIARHIANVCEEGEADREFRPGSVRVSLAKRRHSTSTSSFRSPIA